MPGPRRGRSLILPRTAQNRDADQNPRQFATVSNRRHRHPTIEPHQPTPTTGSPITGPGRLVFIAMQLGLFGVYLGSSSAPGVGKSARGVSTSARPFSGARTGETGQKTGQTGGRTAR
jgi:hypothetical protein